MQKNLIIGLMTSVIVLAFIATIAVSRPAFAAAAYKQFTWRNVHAGDCTLIDGWIVLFRNGHAQWHANAWSTGRSDSWGATVHLKDAAGREVYTFPTVWSPTLPTEPLASSTSDGPHYLGGTWVNTNMQYPSYLYGIIKNASLSSHC